MPSEPTYLVKIDRLARGGAGVGRLDSGKVVFVPDSAPGDILKVSITAEKKSFSEGRIHSVVEPSSFRVTPQCPHYSMCGGCSWMHVSYSEQVNQKKLILEKTFEKIWSKEIQFHKSPSEFHYRSRIQVNSKDGQFHFFARKSHELVQIEQCLIASNEVNSFLRTEKVEDGRWEIGLSHDDKLQSRRMDHPGQLISFSQVNREQNSEIKKVLSKWIDKVPKGAKTLELYAGAGNFSEVLVERFQNCLFVEVDKESVEFAQVKFPKTQWRRQDVLSFVMRNRDPFDFVFVDPPRGGMGDGVSKQILKMNPQNLIYLSCDPMTQQRDIQLFLSNGYKVEDLVGFDMFPQTDHIESMLMLCKI